MTLRKFQCVGVLGLATALGGVGVLAMPLAAAAAGTPTVYEVTDEQGLVTAIEGINASPDADGDVIRFVNTAATTITLTNDLPEFGGVATVAQHITLEGPVAGDGVPLVTIDGVTTWHGPAWTNARGGALSVSHLGITGMRGSGIAVENLSPVDVDLTDVHVANSGMSGFSYNAAGSSVSVANSTFAANQVRQGVEIVNSGGAQQTVTLSGSEASGNAGGYVVKGRNMAIVASALIANVNEYSGLSLSVAGNSTASLKGITVNGNGSAGLDFDIESQGSSVSVDGVEASGTTDGPGVYSKSRAGASLTISGADLANNSHEGLDVTTDSGGNVTFLSSVVRGNGADGGWAAAGIGSGNDTPTTVLVRDVSVINNQSNWSGLVVSCEVAGTAIVENTTISGNALADDGAALSIYGCDDSHVTNTTVADNIGGGLDMSMSEGTVSNSILSGNSVSDLILDDMSDVAVNHTLSQTATEYGEVALTDGNGNLTDGTSPVLAPLAYNGGPALGSDGLAFQTRLPAATSPAVDAGDNALVPSTLTTDQRGARRIQGAGVEMGAVEVIVEVPGGSGGDDGGDAQLAATGVGSPAAPLTAAVLMVFAGAAFALRRRRNRATA